MESRRRVRREADAPVRDLRSEIAAVADDGIRAALLKDIHLSEAAILYGVPVASQDSRQRRYLEQVGESYALAAKVQWFNPVQDSDWETWVYNGCVERSEFCCT
ncbi:hypothetical protein GCM10009737_10520 [Nocardioides lentus]|uniref:Uncharacterized protein n=1 Tax=Nocardioides lentus TaxID=338077 RepID=A0ABN2P418_9ACTN